MEKQQFARNFHRNHFVVHTSKNQKEGAILAINKRGKQSFVLPQLPVIQAWASIAGKKESEGPLAHTFDQINKDTYFGQATWEQAEKQML